MTTTRPIATATAVHDATTRCLEVLALVALLLAAVIAPTTGFAQVEPTVPSIDDEQPEVSRLTDSGLSNQQLVERQLELGQYFYKVGHYFRAIGAFEEVAFFTEEPGQAITARASMAMAYQRAGEHEAAIQTYDDLLDSEELSQDLGGYLRVQRAMARADGWLAPGPDDTAPDVLIGELEPLTHHDDRPYRLDARYQLARLHLLDRDRDSARKTMAALERDCLDQPTSPAPCRSIRKLKHGLAQDTPKRRSPALGLILSTLIPGAGSAYAGHYVDGLYYLGLTGFGGWISYELYDESNRFADQRASFYTVGAVTALIYTANIVRGWTASARFNAVERETYRRDLYQKTRIPMPLERR